MMGRNKDISPENRGAILALSKEGFSVREIAAKGYAGKSAVADLIRKNKANLLPTKRPGRPSLTTKRDDRILRRICKQNPFDSSTVLSKKLLESTGTNISDRSIRRKLVMSNLKSHRPAFKPWLSKVHQLKRLKFAKEHASWSLNKWKTVIFSDESPFSLFGNRGSIRVRREQGERFNSKFICPTVKHPETVHIWSCFCWHGVGHLEVLEKMKE